MMMKVYSHAGRAPTKPTPQALTHAVTMKILHALNMTRPILALLCQMPYGSLLPVEGMALETITMANFLMPLI
jgi:hypothetical protein